MDLRIVFLDATLDHALVALLVPVNVQLHPQQVVDSIWTLDHLQRSLHAAAGKKQRVRGAQCRLRRSKALPLRQWFGSDDGEGGVTACGHRNGIGGLRFAQPRADSGHVRA